MGKKRNKYQEAKKNKITITKGINESSFSWKKHYIPAILLSFIAIALYAYSVTFEYVLDDQIVLTQNSYVHEGFNGIKDILSTESMTGRFGEQKDLIVGARYRPLSLVSFAIEYHFFGLNTVVSHAINVLLYGLLGLLLYRLLCLLFPENDKWYWSIPFIATLLFIIHPIHTEVVANVKGRDEIMMLLGAFGTMYFSLRYSDSNKFIHLCLSSIIFFLALLAKESALTFLAIIPLTFYFFRNIPYKKIAYIVTPLLLMAIFYLTIRYQVIGYFLSPDGREITDIMNNPFYGLNVSKKLATVFYTLGLYLKLLVFPHPLTHDYYPYQIPILNWGDWRAVFSLVLYIILLAITIIGIKKKSLVSYGILFYLITLSIVSNLPFTVGTFMNERFLFAPSLGFCLITAWLLIDKVPFWLKNNKSATIMSAFLLGIMGIGFVGKTLDRVPDWKNRLTLNLSGAAASPNSARANCFLATAIFEEEYLKETDRNKQKTLIKEVAYFVDRSLSIHPTYSAALTMQSGVVAEEYKFDRDLDKLLGEFYSILQRKRYVPFIEQYTAYLIGVADNKKLADFCYKVGFQHYTQVQKDYNKAVQYLKYGLETNPKDARIIKSMAETYQLMGDTENANRYLARL